MVRTSLGILSVSLLVIGISGLIGCTKEPSPTQASNPGKHEDIEHGHDPGIIAMGDYHARIMVEENGMLHVHMLAKDETKVAVIEEQVVKGHLQAEGATEATPVTLKSNPQPGDPKGKTSQFVGAVPEKLRGTPFTATFHLMIAGERYRPHFPLPTAGGHSEMPQGLSRDGEITEDEKDLYLTPGGIYTADDIKANGNAVPSEKFKGMRWLHPKAQTGDRLCPVTDNKADPRCSWIVAGKKYEFCCPPCLDRFLIWAKDEPEMIKDPEEYVKK